MKRNIPIITYLIIAINVVIFILETLSGGSTNQTVASAYGAMYTPLVYNGQYYRLFTSMFLHFGVAHIAMNMYSFLNIGPSIEMLYGKIKFLIIYLLSGISGNLLVYFIDIHRGTYALNAGASGAIFGILGAYVALALSSRFRNSLSLRSVLISVVIALLPGFFISGISLTAHVGGLVGGFLVALILLPTIGPKRPKERQVEQHEHGQVIYYNNKPKR